jgi:hypothetical protein
LAWCIAAPGGPERREALKELGNLEEKEEK